MINYPLRNMDDDIWRKAKTRAARDRISLRAVIERALAAYGARGLDAFDGGKRPRRTITDAVGTDGGKATVSHDIP